MRHYLFTVLLSALIIHTGWSQCTDRFLDVEADSFILHKNIYFGENTSENGELTTLLLDVYEPALPSEEARPMVIWVHGGSFTGGSKEDGEVRWFCEDMAKRGIIIASVNYRVESNPLSLISKERMVKAVVRAVEDVKASIRFIHKSIEEGNEWNIDPDAILLGGTSAGSITNLHTVFMDEYSTLENDYKQWIQELGIDTVGIHGNSGNPGYSERIAGLINISGAIAQVDFMNNNADIPLLNIHNSIDLAVPYTFGYPYFIPTLPIVAGSRPIHFRMDSIGGTSKLITVQGINHVPHTTYEGEQLQPLYDDLLDEILRFVADNSPCNDIVTAVQDHSFLGITAYPNPAYDRIHLEGIEDIDQYSMDLVRTDGSIALHGLEAEHGTVHLPYSMLAKGFYWLRGVGTDKMFSIPLIIH